MRVRISGPGPKGNMERLEATVKEVTNWDGLSMVSTHCYIFLVAIKYGMGRETETRWLISLIFLT